MSGLVGVLNLDASPVDRTLLDRMTEYLAFRGPDGQRVSVSGNIGLGHAHLAIDDDADDDVQPFTLDGSRWIVADARVDAREDLIAELNARAAGEVASDATDAELILRAYCLWGEDCVRHMIGDFCFAVWDEPQRRLFCARDHLGVKPLFYAHVGSTVIVSNTLDCIRLHPAVSDRLHDPAIGDFLLFGANEDVETTTFRDIARLPAGHSIAWTNTMRTRRRYWTLPIDEAISFPRADDYTERFIELLQLALRDRLRTRRVGVLMSGGIDSTTLAAAALTVLRERSAECSLQAITSVYDRLVPDSDRGLAGLVADHLRIPIHYDVRDDETSILDWDRVSVRTPEPIANPPGFAAAVAFSKNMAPVARVFLYGEGPDDALRYEWRPYLWHLTRDRRLSSLVRALWGDLVMHPRVPLWSSIRHVANVSSRRTEWRETLPAWLNEEFALRCGLRDRWDIRRRNRPQRHPFRPAAYDAFFASQWQSLFEDCDINGALSHTETRHPYLDVRLLRYMLALPPMPWCRNKLIVRRSMRASLPDAVLRRKKTSLRVNPDFVRVVRHGLPRLVPAPDLLEYVDPRKMPSVPRSALELRRVLRPLGLNYWLQDAANNRQGDLRDGFARYAGIA